MRAPIPFLRVNTLTLDLDNSTANLKKAIEVVELAVRSLSISTHLNQFLFSVGDASQMFSVGDASQEIAVQLSTPPLNYLARDERVKQAWALLLSLTVDDSHREDIILHAVKHVLAVANLQSDSRDIDTPPGTPGQSSTSGQSLASTVATNLPATPQKTTPTAPCTDTPAHANSALPYSQSGQTHDEVDPYLRTELRDTICKDVKGFHSFFPDITEDEWTCVMTCPPTCTCTWPQSGSTATTTSTSTIMPFPQRPTEVSVLSWFNSTINEHHLASLHHDRRYYNSPNRPLLDSISPANRQCDLYLAPLSPPASDPRSWQQVLVPGELKLSHTEDCTSGTIIGLASYAREVFGAQINRRFVHAFTICGSLFRCYLFDRAGVSISEPVNIYKNQKSYDLFVRIMCGYAAMTLEQLGFNVNYIDMNHRPFIFTKASPEPAYFQFNGRLFQFKELLFHRPVIVSRGTTCWLGKDMGTGELYVIKDSWRCTLRTPEAELLKIASDRNVWGISTPFKFGDVTLRDGTTVDSITNLRSQLSYASARRIAVATKKNDVIYILTNHISAPILHSSASSASSTPSSRRKRSHNNSDSTSALPSAKFQRLYRPPCKAPAKRQRKSPVKQNTPGEVTAGSISYTVDSIKPGAIFTELTHAVIISPTVGKPIAEFTSIQELLEAFCDAIICKQDTIYYSLLHPLRCLLTLVPGHNSLLEDGHILHRDISPNNILINKSAVSPKGFLIDLDLAKEIDMNPGPPFKGPRTQRRTGTFMFMAIEVLDGRTPHTWRHDLESFLYVLIWICTTQDGQLQLSKNWSAGKAQDTKYRQMTDMAMFEELLSNFAPNLCEQVDMPGVVKQMKEVLFPWKEDKMMGIEIGTLADRRGTYEAIVEILNKEIEKL